MEVPASFDILSEDDIWICDTGASSHSTHNKSGATNVRASGSTSLGHTGDALQATSTFDLAGMFLGKDGSERLKCTLTDVSYSNKLNFNLLSLSRLLFRGGWQVTRGDRTGITIQNREGKVIKFDIVIPTARGAIYAVRFVRDTEVSAAYTEAGVRMNIKKAHGLLGHRNEDDTRATAKQLAWTITRGSLAPCLFCARAKAKQKNVTQVSTSPKATVPGERVYLDLSKVTVSRDDGSEFQLARKHWKSVVCEATGKKWFDFTETKSGMVENTCELFSQLKARGIAVRYVRLDPGGENIKLEKRAKSADWQRLQPIDFEFTSRDTPQHNNLAELSFPNLAGKARAMMGAAYVPDDSRGKVAIEAIKCACMLDGLAVITLGDKTATRDIHMYGQNPKWAVNLRTWGEAGVVKVGKDGKTGDRGKAMMFVGYPTNRESDSVRMWDPDTNRVVTTRDVIYLKRMFYERPDHEPPAVPEPQNDDANDEEQQAEEDDDDVVPALDRRDAVDDDDDSTVMSNDDENSIASETEAEDEIIEVEDDDRELVAEEDGTNDATTTRSGRVSRPVDRLIETGYADLHGSAVELRYLGNMAELDNPELSALHMTEENLELDLEGMLVGAGVGGGFQNTKELKVMNYRQAMASDDADAWIDEVKNEKERFDKYKVVKVVSREDVPEGAKIMTTTWAMKKKTSGKLRGRLNARGFEQVEGVHYFADSIAAPVTNANTVRIALTLFGMNPDWVAEIVDVEGAFLQGKFTNGEEMYMEIPDGMEKFYGSKTSKLLKLLVPIYGTKQAAHCFYQRLVDVVKNRKYERSKADPCLYFCWNEGRLFLMLSWVDDLLALGHKKDVEQCKKDLAAAFAIKPEGEMTEYVGSKIDVKRLDNGVRSVKFTQPVLVQKLKDEFDLPAGGAAPKTPAVAGQVLIKGDGSGTLGGQRATKYRSGTAVLMFMEQWSRPDIYNATRNCARHMSAPRLAHEKALQHLMRYVVSTPERGLVLTPNRVWDGSKDFEFEIHGRSDSDYATNPDDRKSCTGARTFLEGCPVMFKSATQKTVTLSVTEAEQAAGVTEAQDMLYTYRVIESIGLKVKLPMLLEMDNSGAVDLANNFSIGGRTRHVDVRQHFLRELKDEGLLVIKHVDGDSNDADIFTKNTEAKVFNRHLPKYVGKDKYMHGGEKKVRFE